VNYKKIVRDNYTLHVVDTDRFKSIDLLFYFTKKFDKKNIKFYSSLVHNLTYSSKKYNSKDKIAKKGEELYGMNIASSFTNIGMLERFCVDCNFLNPIYTSEEYYKESLDFFFEILFNPNVSDKKFDSKYFNIIKNDIKTSILSLKDYPKRYASEEFNKIMFKGLPISYPKRPTLKELDEVNESNLYEFYENLFNGEYKIDIVLFGEVKSLDLKYIESKLKNIKGNNDTLKLIPKNKSFDKHIEKIDSLKFNQSVLYMGYKLDNLTDFEKRYVMNLYNTILGTMNNSILFKIVREDNSLCYSISSYYSRYTTSLVIYSGINKINYEKTVKLIKECINMMSDINIINKNIDAAKKTINTYLNNYYDDACAQADEKYMKEFDDFEDVETRRQIINNITAEEIIEINKKIKLAVTYLLKGDN